MRAGSSENSQPTVVRPSPLRISESPVKSSGPCRYIMLPGECPGVAMAVKWMPSNSSASPPWSSVIAAGAGGSGSSAPTMVPNGAKWLRSPRTIAASAAPTNTVAAGNRVAAAT